MIRRLLLKNLTLCLLRNFRSAASLKTEILSLNLIWQTATSSTVSAKLREESTSVVGCITAFAVMTRSTPKQSHPSMPLTISLCSAVQKLLVFLSTSRQKSVGTSATQPQTKPLSQLTARILISITLTAQSRLKS